MKRLLAIFIAIMLFVPSFVYAEGGKEMASSTKKYANTVTSPYYNKLKNDTITTPKSTKSTKSTKPYANTIKRAVYTTPTVTEPDYEALLAQQQAQYEAQLQALREAQYQSRVEALDKQKNSALSGLESEKSTIAPRYYDKRNQAGAQSDIGALNFAQFMASRGVQGNAGAMPEVYRNASLQGQIGALNQQEVADHANIEARRADINSAYESDLAAARADIDAQTMAAAIENQRLAQQNALEQQRYDTQQKLAADATAYNRLQDTKSDYANTVGQFSKDYQAEIEKVKNDGDPSNDWQLSILSAARSKKIQELEEAKAAQQAAEAKATQQQFENDLKLKQLDLDTKRTNYTINRPYSSGGNSGLTANQQLNQTNNAKVSQMTNWIYDVPTNAEALNRLTQNKAMILQQLMEAGYDGSQALKYWNDMYTDLTGI